MTRLLAAAHVILGVLAGAAIVVCVAAASQVNHPTPAIDGTTVHIDH